MSAERWEVWWQPTDHSSWVLFADNIESEQEARDYIARWRVHVKGDYHSVRKVVSLARRRAERGDAGKRA